MATLTLRPDDQTAEALKDEYEEYGFDTLSDYLRHLLEHRDEIMNGAPSEATLADRVEELEQEVERMGAALSVIQPVGVPQSGTFSDISGAEYRGPVDGDDKPTPAAAERGERADGLADLDLPGSGDTLDARREALQGIYERLQERGAATKAVLLAPVDADAVGYASADSFWTNCISGAGTLSRLPGVEPPPDGGRTWRYHGDRDE